MKINNNQDNYVGNDCRDNHKIRWRNYLNEPRIVRAIATLMLCFSVSGINMMPCHAAPVATTFRQETPFFGMLEDVINHPDSYMASDVKGHNGNRLYRVYGKPVFNNINDAYINASTLYTIL